MEEVLKDYEINIEQFLCIVMDNALNMLSTINKMNQATKESTQLQPMDKIKNVTVGDPETAQAEKNNEIQIIDDEVEKAAKPLSVELICCSVYTLQLAVRDKWQDRHAATLIAKLRQVTVAAKTPKTNAILKRRAGKRAILNQSTRWGNTYLMIRRVLEI